MAPPFPGGRGCPRARSSVQGACKSARRTASEPPARIAGDEPFELAADRVLERRVEGMVHGGIDDAGVEAARHEALRHGPGGGLVGALAGAIEDTETAAGDVRVDLGVGEGRGGSLDEGEAREARRVADVEVEDLVRAEGEA